MKYFFLLIELCVCFAVSAGITFSGTDSHVIEISPDSNTGLEGLYVIENTREVVASFPISSNDNVECYVFSSLGAAYAQPISFNTSNNTISFPLQDGDKGYIISVNHRQHCFWVIDYSEHEMQLDGAEVDEAESDCAMTAIAITGSAPRILYYTITGAQRELSREIEIFYTTLSWDEESENYVALPTKTTQSYLSSLVRVNAPLCDTRFEITGDRFLEEWGRGLSFTTSLYNAVAVEAHVTATQSGQSSDNEIKDNSSELGGSAPADINFSAVTTDAVMFREWQISRDPEFDIIDLRFNQDDIDYTFREQGTTYVRFLAANASGDCDWTSEVFQVNIGDSRLECPNAFSPGASEGVNDEWKVSYRSIIKFECHIFNRWGVQVFKTTDPSIGWDGKYNGHLVPAGVYFYVIKATGADGKNYNRSGDINIINYNKNNSLPSQE